MLEIVRYIRNASSFSLVMVEVMACFVVLIGIPLGYLLLRLIFSESPNSHYRRIASIGYLIFVCLLSLFAAVVFFAATAWGNNYRLTFSIACTSLAGIYSGILAKKVFS